MRYVKYFEGWITGGHELPDVNIDELVPENVIMDAFEEKGLSCDKKDNKVNEIIYESNTTILVGFTSKAYGGEMPKNLTGAMSYISDKIGATSWTFWEPMSSVKFFYDEDKYPQLYT